MGLFIVAMLLVLSLAGYRATRFIIEDTITEGIRNKIWSKFPPSTKLGYLITCYWCTGFWVSLVLVTCFFAFPIVTLVVSLVLAISALIGIISALLER